MVAAMTDNYFHRAMALRPARHAEEGGREPSVACSFETKISPEQSGCLLLPLGR